MGVHRVSALSVAVFRGGFGVAGVLLVARFFIHGWIDDLYIEPTFHFTYPGFSWVEPLGGVGMYWLFGALGVAAFLVGVGFRHRVFSAAFAVMFAYVELIDRVLYLNHYYWLILTALLLTMLPMSQVWSVDAVLDRERRSLTVPGWVISTLRAQVAMVYIFAGIAKINSDWLIRGEPLASWLPARADFPLIGSLLLQPTTAVVLSWAGMLFDLTIVGWLLVPKTRRYAYVSLVIFHSITWLLFPSIGLFPLVMIMSTTIFFAPDWPSSRSRLGRVVTMSMTSNHRQPRWLRPTVVGYLVVMAVLPLRHLAYQSDVLWSGEGYLFSWRVMLTERAGSIEYLLTEPGTGREWIVFTPEELTMRQAALLPTDPVLIQQMAAYLAEPYEDVEVRAETYLSFNGRLHQPYTDPEVNLLGDVSPKDFILPQG